MFMVLSLPAIAFENMNGDYVITKTPNAGTAAYNTKWGDYRNELGGVEYFDMYVGPFTSLYSQVWWAALPAVEMPDDIKKRFNDSAMAILGYEVDQVRKKGDKDVDGSILAEDVSVPINVAYNVRNPPPASCFSLPSSPPFLCVPVPPTMRLPPPRQPHAPLRRPATQHHHDAFFTGKHSRMAKVPYDPSDKSISQMCASLITHC